MRIVFRCLPELEPLLPRPVPAKRGLPDWLKAMPLQAESEDAGKTVKTVKRCAPFVDAMSLGVLVPLPCDLHYSDGCFEWSWSDLPPFPRHTPRAPLGFHVAAQVTGTPLYRDDTLTIKFHNLWTIETEPGYALLVTHPINRPDLPFRTLTGLVDTDRYSDNYVHFPAVWSDPDFAGTLPRGTPVAQCVPVPRQALELDFAPLAGQSEERMRDTQERIVAPGGSYRRRFRAKRG